MSKRSIYTRVKECDLDSNAYLEFASALAFHNDKDVRITIERKRKPITHEMHAYYRAVVLPQVHNHYLDAGYEVTKSQVHRALKAEFGPEEDVGIIEPNYKKKESMADYTKEESVKFIESIGRAFAEHGVYIPQPNENLTGGINGFSQ